jgi:hypothetical protein
VSSVGGRVVLRATKGVHLAILVKQAAALDRLNLFAFDRNNFSTAGTLFRNLLSVRCLGRRRMQVRRRTEPSSGRLSGCR